MRRAYERVREAVRASADTDRLDVATREWCSALGIDRPRDWSPEAEGRWGGAWTGWTVNWAGKEFSMTAGEITLLALGLLAVGTGAYRLGRKRPTAAGIDAVHPQAEQDALSAPSHVTASIGSAHEDRSPTVARGGAGTLVAVVRATRASFLPDVMESGRLDPSSAAELYRSCVWLWAGPFPETAALEGVMSGEGTGTGSEYDVFLIEAEVERYGRFDRGATPAERLSAFAELGTTGAKVRVSPRHDTRVVERFGFFEMS